MNYGQYNHRRCCNCCCDCLIGIPGPAGTNGISPHVGTNGNWWIGDKDTAIAAQGSAGAAGEAGENGISPNIGENGNWWIGEEDTGISAQGPRGEPGTAGIVPTVYHANLSTAGSFIDIPLAQFPEYSSGRVVLTYSYANSTETSLQVRAAGAALLIDLKRATQWGPISAEGSSIDDTTITTARQTTDATIYNQSTEMHRVWLRVRSPATANVLWSMYEINYFPSANGARCDIWIFPIYENEAISWD